MKMDRIVEPPHRSNTHNSNTLTHVRDCAKLSLISLWMGWDGMGGDSGKLLQAKLAILSLKVYNKVGSCVSIVFHIILKPRKISLLVCRDIKNAQIWLLLGRAINPISAFINHVS